MSAIYAFLVAVVYVPWLSGAAITPRWAVMAVGAAVLTTSHVRSPRLTQADAFGLTFLLYAALSLLWSPVFYDAADELMKIAIMAVIYSVGSRLENLRQVYIGFGLGMAVNSGLLIYERVFYGQALPHFGLFFNPGSNGEPAAMVMAGLAMSGLWWIVIAVWPSLILSGSRASLLGVFAAILVWQWPRSRWRTIAILCLGLAAAAVAHKDPGGIFERLNIWQDTMSGLTIFGHGVGSFWQSFPPYATFNIDLIRPDHAHNDFLELAFEFGIGSVLFAGMLVVLARHAQERERLVLVTFAVIAVFGFPLHLAATAFLFAIVAGHVAGRSPVICRFFPLRRRGIQPSVLG